MAAKGIIEFQIGNGTNPNRYLQATATSGNNCYLSYTVQSGDAGRARINQQPLSPSIEDVVGIRVAANTDFFLSATPLQLGNVSTMQPTVTAVAITSTGPYTDTTTATGDAIDVTVTFSEAVEVTGTPQIALTIGEVTTAQADYASISTDKTVLTFSRSIVAADAGDVSIAANALATQRG